MTDRKVVPTNNVAFASKTFDAMFKIKYDDVMGQIWTSFSPLLEWLESEGSINREAKPEGRYIEFPVELKLTQGVGVRGEGDSLPTATPLTTARGKVDYQKGFKGRISISEEAIEWGRKGSGAFENVLEQEMRANEQAIRALAGVAVWGVGDGMLAKTASASTTTITVTSSENYNTYNPGTRLLYEGMNIVNTTVSSKTPTTDTNGPATTVVSITNDTTFVVGTSWASMSAGYATDPGSYTTAVASSSRWPAGLKNIVDDGTFSDSATLVVDPAFGCCGLPVSTYPTWKAAKSHNSGTLRALTTDLIYQMFGKLSRKVGSFKPRIVAWTNWDILREFVAQLEPSIQYKPRGLEAGFNELDIMINGLVVPFKIDHKAPSEIFFVDPKHITFYNARPLGLVKPNGRPEVIPADYTSREYRWWWAFNLGTNKRNAHGLITDLSKTITVV